MVRPAGSFENGPMNTGTERRMSADAAISEVLRAERDALAQISACENQADQVIQEARKAVRRLVRHTQDRISRLHAGCAARTAEMVAEIERAAPTGAECALPGDKERQILQEAVRSVARELTEPVASDAG